MLRELASSLKLRGGGARLGEVVALLVIDRLGRVPVLIGGFVVPEPGHRCVPRSRCPGVNGGPLILERIYPTSCSRPRSKPRRSVSCTGTSGVGAATLSPSRHSGLSATWVSATMRIAAEIAGVGVLVSYFTAPATRGRSPHEAVWQ